MASEDRKRPAGYGPVGAVELFSQDTINQMLRERRFPNAFGYRAGKQVPAKIILFAVKALTDRLHGVVDVSCLAVTSTATGGTTLCTHARLLL